MDFPYPKSIIESGLLDHVAGALESIKSGTSMYVVLKARSCTCRVRLASALIIYPVPPSDIPAVRACNGLSSARDAPYDCWERKL